MKQIFKLLSQLWFFSANKNKRKIFLLFFFSVFCSIFEILSIGSLIPFFGILVNPDNFLTNLPLFINKATSPHTMLTYFTFIFISLILFASFLRLTLLYSVTKVSYGIGHDLSVKIFEKILNQNYEDYCNLNSSKVLSGITEKVNNCIEVIFFTINFISSFIILFFILLAMFFFNVQVACVIFFILGGLYISIIFLAKKISLLNSYNISIFSSDIIKYAQEAIGGYRDIVTNHSHKFFTNLYKFSDKKLRFAYANNIFIGTFPKYIIEGLTITTIALIGWNLSLNENNFVESLQVLAVYVFAIQRLFPITQQIYSSYTGILGRVLPLKDIINLISIKGHHKSNFISNKIKMDFKKSINLNNISFKYKNSDELILDNITININKGDWVAIIGKSGTGKTTLIDIIMGLLSPSSGTMLIDGKKIHKKNISSWYNLISNVPQDIFILDDSIKNNIIFGQNEENVDFERLQHCIRLSQLEEFVDKLPLKENTILGERGSLVSGGQKQRIGIARALYKNSSIIILDESTSALDSDTEKEFLSFLNKIKKNFTIISISHKRSSIKYCNKIFELKNKKIRKRK